MTRTRPDRDIAGGGRRPTANDVAQRAGVSQTTVSFVVNNTENRGIPEATRQRVLAAARDLGYRPSAAAKVLASGRSTVVLGLLGDVPIGHLAGRLLERLSSVFSTHGLSFIVQLGPTAGPSGANAWQAIDVAAMVTLENLADGELAARHAAGILHVVAVYGHRADDPGSLADIEERTGRLQAEHLVSIGHGQLGYAWPADPRLDAEAEQRFSGVRQACRERGLPDPVRFTAPPSPEGTAKAIQECFDSGTPMTGVCAFNDETALAVLAGAHHLGLAVPEQLAVIGVDDDPAAAVSIPPLTTVTLDLDPVVRFIVDTVVAKLQDSDDPPTPGGEMLTLNRRKST